MNPFRNSRTHIIALLALASAGVISLAQAQSTPPATDPHAQHAQQAGGTHQNAPPTEPTMKDLVDQIAGLRAEVARLQAALAQGHSPSAGMPMPPPRQGGMQPRMGMGAMGSTPSPSNQPSMPGMGGAPGGMPGMSGGSGGGKGMMDDKMMGGMGGMSGGAGGGGMGMDGMMKMMGMGNMPMGGAGSPAAMAMPSALPGFPGASHIYHVGATGFFLDHPEHITLTLDQQTALNQRKERTLLQQAEFQRKIEQAEQELWVLTAADQPDAAAIDKKVQEIAKLQGDQRVAFIRAVGEAAQVLTDEQRQQLTGMLPPAPTPMPPATPAASGMPASGGMSDM